MNIELGQIIAQILAFLIMLAVLKRYAWKPLLNLLDERRERIRNEFETIEQRKKEVEALRQSYQEKVDHIETLAKKLGQDEVGKARILAREIEEDAHQRARQIVTKAQTSAEEELVKARKELRKELVQLTISATEAVLQKNLDKDQQRELIAQYIAEAKLK